MTIDVLVNGDDPNKVLKVGSQLGTEVMRDLVGFLRTNIDVFAWTHSDMCGISSGITSHALNINPRCFPVKQKRRSMGLERSAALKEVDKLKNNGFIRDALYPDWVSNHISEKKTNKKWKTCIDYSDLNRTCPKVSFLLPMIDQLVDSTVDHELLSFMDAYSGYTYILMHVPDQEYASFIIDLELYCYSVIPFELKNAEAT